MKINYSTQPALWFAAVFSMGIGLGWLARFQIQFHWILPVALIMLVFAIVSWKRFPKFFIWPAMILVFLLGMGALQNRLLNTDTDELFNLPDSFKIYSFSGVIAETQYRIGRGDRYVLDCDTVFSQSVARAVRGKILLRFPRSASRLKPGDRVKMFGSPQRPSLPKNPGDFNYRHYLQINGIFYQFRASGKEQYQKSSYPQGYWWQRHFLQPIRDHIRQAVDNRIGPPARDVIKALILGERQDLDRQLLTDFQRSGIIHVLAISGLHAGFILLIFLLIFSFLGFSYHNRVILALICLWLFVALVNFKTPVIRASLMATFYFAGRFGQRRIRPLNMLGVAAMIILLWDPAQLLLPGFQFSFAAVGGILYGYPLLRKWFAANRWRGKVGIWMDNWVRQPFLVSLAAVLATLPLTWYHYGVIQVGAVLINILIIPFIFLYIVCIFVYLLLYQFPIIPLDGLAWLLENLFNLVYAGIHWFSALPWVQWRAGFPGLTAALLAFALVMNFFHRKWFHFLTILMVIYFIRAGLPFREEPSSLRVTFLSVGQGDGAIIRFPNGRVMVVDGGDRNFSFDAGTHYMLPFLIYENIDRITYLVGSHGHSDHIGGLVSILKEMPVDTLVLPSYRYRSALYKELLKQAARQGTYIAYRQRGDRLYPDSTCRVYVLHPDAAHQKPATYSGKEVNTSSLVLKILYGRNSILMTGDLEREAEDDLLAYDGLLRCDVLKVAHHGSITSTSQNFLQQVLPRYGLISVGRHNRFFHPSRKTVQRLRDYGVRVWRTDRMGAMMLESDGKDFRLINWRK